VRSKKPATLPASSSGRLQWREKTQKRRRSRPASPRANHARRWAFRTTTSFKSSATNPAKRRQPCPGGDAERTLLETALREYAAAETQADAAQRTSQAQRKVEESQLNPGDYAARRTKVAADDAKLAQKLQVAQAQLDEAERQLALLSAADRQAKQAATPGACDVKKVDWANRTYMGPFNGAFTLAKGGAHNAATGEIYQLGPVSYGDLNGNGSTEAYVPIQGPGGPRGGLHLTVYVYEVDKSCVAKLLANLDGGPYAETGALKGKAYVIHRNQLGELGMPGDEETIKFVFKGGKYVEEG
jgi:hypothetical protein